MYMLLYYLVEVLGILERFLFSEEYSSGIAIQRNMEHDRLLSNIFVAGLKLLDMISDDNKDENRGLKRLPTEAYAIFSQDGEIV